MKMRLLQLHENGKLILTADLIHDVPSYAILSHTWGSDGQEVVFEDLMQGSENWEQKAGYQKILFCGRQAKADGINHFWVDTCCIDKKSSAELTEAINSMYKWYRDAKKCYVYLADVPRGADSADADELKRSKWKAAFRRSNWFTRGWTLQELIAPPIVEFFSSDEKYLGDRQSLEQVIHEVTRIPHSVLQGRSLSSFSVNERMSWSNKRRTTRPEDSAYSLLGILDISLAVIYGEGEDRALDRLRREANVRHYGKRQEFAANVTLDANYVAHYYIPFPKNRKFTGRDEILSKIKERLFGQEGCQSLAIVGLGGMGKTQIALQLAHWVKEHQPAHSVLWIPALSLESYEQAATEIAKRLNLKQETAQEDIKASLQRHLETTQQQKWFIVVDNADNLDVLYGSTDSEGQGIHQYLPTTENCTILFTTRLRDIALSVADTDLVELTEMSLEEATDFFRKAILLKAILKDEQTIAELLEELALLPLAIAQAVAYLNRNRLPVKRYLDLLRHTEREMVELMSVEFQDLTRYRGSRNAVANTWLVSFDQIRQTDPFAADILLFISLIEPRGVPRSILPQAETEIDTERAIGTLCGYAFLTDRGNDVYDMHRLVHIAAKVWKSSQESELVKNAIEHVSVVFPTSEPANRDLWRVYMPHAIRLLDLSGDCKINERYDLSYSVGQCLSEDRRFKEAIPRLEETYKWRKSYMHKDDKSLVRLEKWLAGTCLDGRQITKAIAMLEHVVKVRARTLPEDNHSRLNSEHELGSAYLMNKQCKEAITILEHVVGVERKTMDERNSSRLVSEQELAGAYLDNGSTQDAIKILERIVAIRRETLDEYNYFRLSSEHELARAYLKDGSTQDAIDIFEHVVAGRRETLHKTDHARVTSERMLASAYFDKGLTQDAISLFERVVAVRAETLDEKDHSRLNSEYELARAYLKARVTQKAVDLLEHVVAVESRLLDEHNSDRRLAVTLLKKAYDQLESEWESSKDESLESE